MCKQNTTHVPLGTMAYDLASMAIQLVVRLALMTFLMTANNDIEI